MQIRIILALLVGVLMSCKVTAGGTSHEDVMPTSTLHNPVAFNVPTKAPAGSSPVALAKGDKPNIIFIFTDDHGPQTISAYGSNRNKTPNIDRIAREGMLFRRCLVTNSICGPSRAVIQTGKYSHVNGFIRNGNRFNGAQQTFPKILHAVSTWSCTWSIVS